MLIGWLGLYLKLSLKIVNNLNELQVLTPRAAFHLISFILALLKLWGWVE